MPRKLNPEEFLGESPQGVVVDVRTPAEFDAGHIPGAHNIPLFSNEQRAVVGTLYVRTGRQQAILKGLEFVGPRMAHIAAQALELAAGRTIYLYCWRGGMRSGSVAWLLETAGMQVALLDGGYKAYRRSFDDLLMGHQWRFIMLSGPTGCGKTELLSRLAALGEQVLDLEGIAHHKGSAFGALGQQPQPTTEHFINLLHDRFIQLSPSRPVWCEGESVLVGHVFIPQTLFTMLRKGLIVQVTMDTEQRLDRLMTEYGSFPTEDLQAAFMRIAKRMGREQVAAAVEALNAGDIRTAARLALHYYDKSYAKNNSEQVTAFWVENEDMTGSVEKLKQLINEIYSNHN